MQFGVFLFPNFEIQFNSDIPILFAKTMCVT